MQHYTTIEQSKKLMELGLDPLTSDMYYSFTGEHIKDAKDEYFSVSVGLASTIRNNQFSYRYGYVIPCWSVGAILNLIPEGIHWYLDKSGLTIAEIDHYEEGKEVYAFRKLYINPVDAIIWLLENGYIKKGE